MHLQVCLGPQTLPAQRLASAGPVHSLSREKRRMPDLGTAGGQEAVAWQPGFWKAEVGQAHLSRSTVNLVVVLPPRVVFLLFLT